MAVVLEVSNRQLDPKEVIHRQQQRQPIRLPLFPQTKPLEAVTTIHRLKTISQLVQQELPGTRHSVHQQAPDFLALQQELALVNLIQELKPLLVVPHLTPHPDSLNDQPDQLLQLNALELLLAHHKEDSEAHSKDHQPVASDQETKAAVATADRHHQASKMKAKKAITQLFPESLMSIIRSTLKFQRLLSTATSKNSPDTTLMLRPVARSSIFAL